jgi:hypothetical protein
MGTQDGTWPRRMVRRLAATRPTWSRHGIVIGLGLAVMGGSLLALDRHILTGTVGETAIVALWTVSLLGAGAYLRHWSLLAFPVAAFIVGQIMVHQGVAQPPPGAGTPPPGLAWMISAMAAVVVGFLPLSAWCAVRMLAPDGRNRRLTLLGAYVALVAVVSVGLMWSDGEGLYILAFLALVGVAGFVVNRYDAVPVVSLIAWLAIYGAGAVQGWVDPPEYPGETPISAFLESPVFVIAPTLVAALGGTFLRWATDARSDDVGPAGAEA